MAITEQEKRRQQKNIDIIFMVCLYLIGAYYSIHLGAVLLDYEKINILTQTEQILNEVSMHVKAHPFYVPVIGSMTPFYVFSMISMLCFAWYIASRKKLMPGKEHGSQKWSGKNDIKDLLDKENKDKNIILTESEGLSLNDRKIRKNLNVLVIGDPGSGKTRFFIKPNIMQMHTSYVITDPKGEILQDTGAMLKKHGYKIKVFNLFDMAHSDCYSPFRYIEQEEDIKKMIACLIRNTTPPNKNGGDPFWENAEISLLQAICSFIWYKLPENEQNFSSVLRMLRMLKVYEEDEDFEADLDLLFKLLEHEEPDNLAVLQYKDFKAAAGKTLKSILISVNTRLSAFNFPKVADLMHMDTLEIERLPEEKMALFIIVPDSDLTFHFIAAMLYTQIFDYFSKIAFHSKNKKLNGHVRFLLDEFANIGEIPDFAEHLSTMRGKNFSSNIIVQNIVQLEKHYKHNWKTIVNDCNTLLYLAGNEKDSTKYISELLGNETIDVKTQNVTRGRQLSIADNYQKIARPIMTPDEIGRMPDSDCLLLIKGKHPWYSKKFDIAKHKNYKELYDEGRNANYFDYTQFVTPKRPKPALPAVMKEENKQKPKPPVILAQDYNIVDMEVNLKRMSQNRYAFEFEAE